MRRGNTLVGCLGSGEGGSGTRVSAAGGARGLKTCLVEPCAHWFPISRGADGPGKSRAQSVGGADRARVRGKLGWDGSAATGTSVPRLVRHFSGSQHVPPGPRAPRPRPAGDNAAPRPHTHTGAWKCWNALTTASCTACHPCPEISLAARVPAPRQAANTAASATRRIDSFIAAGLVSGRLDGLLIEVASRPRRLCVRV